MRHLRLIFLGHSSHLRDRVEFDAESGHHLFTLVYQHLPVAAVRVLLLLRLGFFHSVGRLPPFQIAEPFTRLRKSIRIRKRAQDLILWVLSEYPRLGLSNPPFWDTP